MRVAEIAELTGTTVRTVRHYHALGLLPVPEERGGWRDYNLSHVARLSRIRWLVSAGVPLSAVGAVLDAEEADPTASTVATDLAAALDAVDERLEEVTRQRDMLVLLLERARSGSTVSPMSPRMAAFFARMAALAPDERTAAAVRRERDVTDLLCYRGLMPPEAEYLFPDAEEDEDAESILAYGRDPASPDAADVAGQAAWIVRRLERRLTRAELRSLARSVDVGLVESLYELVANVDPAYARVAPAVGARFVALIEYWRTH